MIMIAGGNHTIAYASAESKNLRTYGTFADQSVRRYFDSLQKSSFFSVAQDDRRDAGSFFPLGKMQKLCYNAENQKEETVMTAIRHIDIANVLEMAGYCG